MPAEHEIIRSNNFLNGIWTGTERVKFSGTPIKLM